MMGESGGDTAVGVAATGSATATATATGLLSGTQKHTTLEQRRAMTEWLEQADGANARLIVGRGGGRKMDAYRSLAAHMNAEPTRARWTDAQACNRFKSCLKSYADARAVVGAAAAYAPSAADRAKGIASAAQKADAVCPFFARWHALFRPGDTGDTAETVPSSPARILSSVTAGSSCASSLLPSVVLPLPPPDRDRDRDNSPDGDGDNDNDNGNGNGNGNGNDGDGDGDRDGDDVDDQSVFSDCDVALDRTVVDELDRFYTAQLLHANHDDVAATPFAAPSSPSRSSSASVSPQIPAATVVHAVPEPQSSSLDSVPSLTNIPSRSSSSSSVISIRGSAKKRSNVDDSHDNKHIVSPTQHSAQSTDHHNQHEQQQQQQQPAKKYKRAIKNDTSASIIHPLLLPSNSPFSTAKTTPTPTTPPVKHPQQQPPPPSRKERELYLKLKDKELAVREKQAVLRKNIKEMEVQADLIKTAIGAGKSANELKEYLD
ncbi:hypothetical protein HK100_009644, partial [Physocladia obscura]